MKKNNPTRLFGRQMFLMLVMTILVSGEISAQKKFKVYGKKLARVEITDAGEMYSTYSFEETDMDKLREQVSDEAWIKEIEANHTEESWPEQLAGLDYRTDHKDVIQSMAVYRVADLGERIVLAAPPGPNSDLPKGVRPETTIYFVIGKNGLKH